MIEDIYTKIINNYLLIYLLLISVIIIALELINKLTCP